MESPRRKAHFPMNSNSITLRRRTQNSLRAKSRLNTVFSMKIDKSCFSSLECINILKNDHQLTTDDIYKLSFFIGNSEVKEMLKQLNIEDSNIDKLVITWSTFFFLSTYVVNQKLFTFGDEADKVFILLQGEIEVISPEPINQFISGTEYYEEIAKLIDKTKLDKKYDELLNKTITTNNYTYHIDINDVTKLRYVLFKIYYDRYNQQIKNSGVVPDDITLVTKIEELMKTVHISSNDLSITYPLQPEFVSFIQDQIGREMNLVANELVLKYRYLTVNEEKNSVNIYEFKSHYRGEEGAFIGNTKDDLYYETAIASKDTFLITLPFEIYKQYVEIEKEKVKMKEIAFIMKTFIFKEINLNKFKRCYYDFFINKEYGKGDVIVNESIHMQDKVIIIKEGDFLVTMNRSIKEVYGLMKYIKNIIKDKDEVDFDLNVNDNVINFPEELNKKKRYKIMHIGNKDSFGTELVFFGMASIFNVEVISKKAKVYEIEVGNFIKIIEDSNDYYEKVRKYNYYKVKGIFDRLKSIIHYAIKIVNAKATEKVKFILFNDTSNQIKKSKTNNLLNCSTEISPFTNLSFTDQRIKNQTTHVIIDCDKSNTTNMISSISNNDNTASEIYLTTSNNNTLTVNNQKQSLFAYRRKKSKHIYEDKLLHQVKILKQTSHYISNNTIDSNYFSDFNPFLTKSEHSRNINTKTKSSLSNYNRISSRFFIKANKSKHNSSVLNESQDLMHHQKTSTYNTSFESRETNDDYLKTIPCVPINNSLKGKILSTSLLDEKKKKYILYKKKLKLKLDIIKS